MTSRGDTARPLAVFRSTFSLFVVLSAVIPLYLVVKQALTPERESLAWPPSWFPAKLTAIHFASVFKVSELLSAIVLSVVVAVISAALATALGGMLAYSMARRESSRVTGMRALGGLRLLPMIATAIPLAVVLTRLGLYDSPTGIGLAIIHAAVAIPAAALTTYSAFVAVPVELEEAAWLDGATPMRIFVSIDLALARGALAAAFILCFIMSWDEFGFSLLIQVTNRTLPPLLYYYTVFGNVGPASALALIMIIPAVAVTLALRPMLRGSLLAGSFR